MFSYKCIPKGFFQRTDWTTTPCWWVRNAHKSIHTCAIECGAIQQLYKKKTAPFTRPMIFTFTSLNCVTGVQSPLCESFFAFAVVLSMFHTLLTSIPHFWIWLLIVNIMHWQSTYLNLTFSHVVHNLVYSILGRERPHSRDLATFEKILLISSAFPVQISAASNNYTLELQAWWAQFSTVWLEYFLTISKLVNKDLEFPHQSVISGNQAKALNQHKTISGLNLKTNVLTFCNYVLVVGESATLRLDSDYLPSSKYLKENSHIRTELNQCECKEKTSMLLLHIKSMKLARHGVAFTVKQLQAT